MRIYAKDEVRGFRFTRAARGELGHFQPLAVPIRRRTVDISSVRKPLLSQQVRDTPGHPAADCRSAKRERRGSHPPHARSRHQPRLGRTARRRHELGVAHEARGGPGPNRRGSGCDR